MESVYTWFKKIHVVQLPSLSQKHSFKLDGLLHRPLPAANIPKLFHFPPETLALFLWSISEQLASLPPYWDKTWKHLRLPQSTLIYFCHSLSQPWRYTKITWGLLYKDAHSPKRLTSNKSILFTWRCPLTMCSTALRLLTSCACWQDTLQSTHHFCFFLAKKGITYVDSWGISAKPKLSDSLQYNWPVFFKSAKVIKVKDWETVPD